MESQELSLSEGDKVWFDPPALARAREGTITKVVIGPSISDLFIRDNWGETFHTNEIAVKKVLEE